MLDRLVGYQISPLLWKKVAEGTFGRKSSVGSSLNLYVTGKKKYRISSLKSIGISQRISETRFIADLNQDRRKKAEVNSEDETNAIRGRTRKGNTK